MNGYEIKFGTDGWRAIIAREFTVENVVRVGKGIANYLEKNKGPRNEFCVVIGYDTRFGGKLFAESLAISLLEEDINVMMDDHFTTTPMISFASLKLKCDLGVIFTASHNPPSYQGLKIKGSYGGPAFDSMIQEMVKLIPEHVNLPENKEYELLKSNKQLTKVDLDQLYTQTCESRFNLNSLKKDQKNYVFDAMNGSIQRYIQNLFPEMNCIRVDPDPTFKGVSPEPIEKNLNALRNEILSGKYKLGLAVDGDADRIGLMDSKGQVIDAHHIMLILIWYLVKYKGLTGKIVTGFSSTQKIKTLCRKLGLELEIVKIGFKHASAIMLKEDVLLAGEEAGGIATKGHIPERDGLWNLLLIMEMLHDTGKSIEDIQKEISDYIGEFSYFRLDLPLNQEKMDFIIYQLNEESPSYFGDKKVIEMETLDGYKFYFNENEWLMFRTSGTEPLLRIYAESYTKEKAKNLIELGRKHFSL